MRPILLAALLAALLAGCRVNLGAVHRPPESVAVLTGGPWASMLYLARVEGGVIAVDLGWDGDGDALRQGLARLEAGPEDVVAVFLTHSHRDHVAAWPHVAGARFYLAAGEAARFEGREEHLGIAAKWADRLLRPDLPGPGQLDLSEFRADTGIVFGADTVHAYALPGHTPGSAAYLFRGVLFVGDAVTWTPLVGFHSARVAFSDDVGQSRTSLAALWRRIEPRRVGHVCTAHGKCAVPDSAFVREVFQ